MDTSKIRIQNMKTRAELRAYLAQLYYRKLTSDDNDEYRFLINGVMEGFAMGLEAAGMDHQCARSEMRAVAEEAEELARDWMDGRDRKTA